MPNPRPIIRLLALALPLLVSVGCANKKLIAASGDIDALTLTHTTGSSVASVSFGDMAVPEDADVATTATAAATNVTIDVFEVEMAVRLNKEVDAENLSMNTARAAGKRLDKHGPVPSAEEARYRLDIELYGWGMNASTTEPAQAWTNLYAQLYAPSGERIWRRSLSCTSPMSHDTGVDGVAQVALSIGMIRAMNEDELRKSYRTLSRVCGRQTVDAFAAALAKAKRKAAKKGG